MCPLPEKFYIQIVCWQKRDIFLQNVSAYMQILPTQNKSKTSDFLPANVLLNSDWKQLWISHLD